MTVGVRKEQADRFFFWSISAYNCSSILPHSLKSIQACLMKTAEGCTGDMYAINWALENSLGNKMKVTLGEDYGELGERHNAGSVVIWCSRL